MCPFISISLVDDTEMILKDERVVRQELKQIN